MLKAEMAVYRDPKYPSSWIDDKAGYPDRISSFLKGKGFRTLDADQLREFMIDAIVKNEAHRKLIVFSQDVVPRTVAEGYDSNTILREFLDAGGSVLWIGDIPLFFIGDIDKQLDKDAWKKGAPIDMLGINPIFAKSKQTVNITNEGRLLGLKHRWTGIRPILEDSGIRALARSENIISTYYMNIPKRSKIAPLRKLWDRLTAIEIGGIKLGLSALEKGEIAKITAHETHVNAWMKNYSRRYPNSGFIRIWDYSPRLMDHLLEEICNIAKRASLRMTYPF